jgi:hypothetical protein
MAARYGLAVLYRASFPISGIAMLRGQSFPALCAAALFGWWMVAALPRASSAAQAQSASAIDRLRELRTTYQARVERRNPMWLKYLIVKHEMPLWIMRYRKATVDSDVVWRLECELARKGSRYHSSAAGEDPYRPGHQPRQFTIFDKEFTLSTSDKPNTYQLIRKAVYTQHGESPFSVAGEEVLLQLLDRWMAGRTVFETVEWKTADSGLVGLTLKSKKSGWKYAYIFNPALDYSIVSSASYTATGEHIDKTEVQSYESVAGIPIPTKGKGIHYTEGNRIGHTTEFTVTMCKVSASEIPDSLFRYDLPDDSVVFDMDKKIAIRNTVATQRDWDEIVSLVGPRRGHWWSWIIASMVCVAAAAMVLAMRRRYAKAT